MAARQSLISGWSATSSMVTSWLTRTWAVSSGKGCCSTAAAAARKPEASRPPTRMSGCRPATSPAITSEGLGIQPGADVLEHLLAPPDAGGEVVGVELGQREVHLADLVVGDRRPQVVQAVVAVAVGVDDPAVGPAQVGDGGVEGGVAGQVAVLAGLAEHADDGQDDAEGDEHVQPDGEADRAARGEGDGPD